jgi:hypothetical protein
MTNGMQKLRDAIETARLRAHDGSIGFEVFDGAVRIVRNGVPITGRVTLDHALRFVRRVAA